MAATVSSIWAKPGAWALDSEQHEDELKQETPAADFPSLSAAVTNKPSKKKSKGQPMSLSEFVGYKAPSTREEVPLVLPTAPRERTQEELEESRRRGFRTFSDNRDNSRSRPPREDRDFGSSRADEADDWSKMKKAPSSFGSGRDREMGGPSRADEVDDWSKGKRFVGGGAGGGDRTDRRERVGFFNSSRADEVDNWAVNKSSSFAPPEQRRERRVGFDATGPTSDSDNWLKNKVVENGNSGSGRPRLNLQPRTLPVEKIVVKSEVSAPKEVEKEAAFVVTERKPKENPFGAARPREEVLKEKGQDWKEIDDKLEAVKIKEVEKTNSEGLAAGRRRGFGLGSGEERSVRTWRKPDSPNGRPAAEAPAPAPAPPMATPIFGSFLEAAVKSEASTESSEKAPEDN